MSHWAKHQAWMSYVKSPPSWAEEGNQGSAEVVDRWWGVIGNSFFDRVLRADTSAGAETA